MVTKITHNDLPRDALYEKVNTIASELELPDTTNNEGKALIVKDGEKTWGDVSSTILRTWEASEEGGANS